MIVKAKVLIMDIETAPMKGYVWGLWKQNIGLNMLEADWYMLSWAAKWLGSDVVFSDALNLHKDYVPNTENDKEIVESLWVYLDEADIVIGHNMKGFDVKKTNARFLKWGLPPPSPYKVVDTLLIAKKAFKLTSNKLDYIAEFLGVQTKLKHEGWVLWEGCIHGDGESWKTMLKYNEQDITVTENVYMALRPWDTSSPNLALYEDMVGERMICPTCGGDHVHKRGTYKTNVSVYQRYQCQDCSSWFRDRTMNKRTKEQNVNILSNAA